MSDDTSERFVCPECRGEIPADPAIQQALVRHGCVLCGAAIPPDVLTA